MGRPSDRKKSARRPGRRERARVNKHFRTRIWPGAGTSDVKLGRKKLEIYIRKTDIFG